VLVPLLTLFFKVDIRDAVGASLVSVIATSSGAACRYVKERVFQHQDRNVLEIATTVGALREHSSHPSFRQRNRHDFRTRPALLGLPRGTSPCKTCVRRCSRPTGYAPEDEWQLS